MSNNEVNNTSDLSVENIKKLTEDYIKRKSQNQEEIKKPVVIKEKIETKTSDEETKTSDEETKNLEQKKSNNEIEDLKKLLLSKEKAVNDNKRNWQILNQKYVLTKKNIQKFLDDRGEKSILNPENSLLEPEDFDKAVKELRNSLNIKDEDLEINNVKEEENLPKEKILLEKLNNDFNTYKKFHKSKDLDKDYDAFFKSVHLLSSDERENLKEYLEIAETAEAIDYVLTLGSEYRKNFEKGLKENKNIFKYVEKLHEEIAKLTEENNNYKKNVDKGYNKEDNKEIESRPSIQQKVRGYDFATIRALEARGIKI